MSGLCTKEELEAVKPKWVDGNTFTYLLRCGHTSAAIRASHGWQAWCPSCRKMQPRINGVDDLRMYIPGRYPSPA